MTLLILGFLLMVIVLLSMIFVEKFCKSRTSTNNILMGMEFTFVAIFFLLLRNEAYSNGDFILILLASSFFILGLIVSIHGFSKK